MILSYSVYCAWMHVVTNHKCPFTGNSSFRYEAVALHFRLCFLALCVYVCAYVFVCMSRCVWIFLFFLPYTDFVFLYFCFILFVAQLSAEDMNKHTQQTDICTPGPCLLIHYLRKFCLFEFMSVILWIWMPLPLHCIHISVHQCDYTSLLSMN